MTKTGTISLSLYALSFAECMACVMMILKNFLAERAQVSTRQPVTICIKYSVHLYLKRIRPVTPISQRQILCATFSPELQRNREV